MKLINNTNTMMVVLLLCAPSSNVLADLAVGDTLYFGAGSKVSIEASPGFWVDVPVKVNKGLTIGAAKTKKTIDKPFHLFGQASQHLSNSPVTSTSTSVNSAQLDFSSWAMKWKNHVIDLGTGGSNALGEGVADVQCANSCSKGESFTLDYSASIPAEVEALGGLAYRLHWVGMIK